MFENSNSKVRRSISCYSLPGLGVAVDDESHIDEQAEERREMHEALRLRKEALEAAMNAKLAELKALCLREAELTGELPPETPLHPNEPRPVIRRRMRTEFALSDKLLTEPKSKDEEALANLELEFEIQSKIVAASLKLMNEVQTNRSIRKHRKQAYDDAVRKLNSLELKLMPLHKKLEDVRKQSKGKKKQLIIEELNKDSGISAVNLANTYDAMHGEKRIKKKRMKFFASDEYHQHAMFNSVPSSPVTSRMTQQQQLQQSTHNGRPSIPVPTTAGSSFVPISPVATRLHPSQLPRPKSATLARRAGGHRDIDRHHEEYVGSTKSVHFSLSNSDPENVSLNSEGMASVIIHETPPSPRKSILTNSSSRGNKTKAPRYRPATAVGLPMNTHFSGDEFINITSDGIDHTISASAFDMNSELDELCDLKPYMGLVRTNSLDNDLRRKSYISAISLPPSTSSLHHHEHYLNHHPSSRYGTRQKAALPKNPPPPVPSSFNMAQRPLPPPPTMAQSLSVPDVTSPLLDQEKENNQMLPPKVPAITGLLRRQKRMPPPVEAANEITDISARAVRSSVIRTPVGITISTTSSSETQNSMNNSSNNVLPSSSPSSATASPKRPVSTPRPLPVTSTPPESNSAGDECPSNFSTPGSTSSAAHTANAAASSSSSSWQQSEQQPPHTEIPSRPPSVASSSRSFSSSVASYKQHQPPPLTVPLIATSTDSSHGAVKKETSESPQTPRTPSVESQSQPDDLEGIRFADSNVLRSESRQSVETPRPVSIPMAPAAVSSGAQVDVVSVGHFTPYWEETKPYELSDFYKYSAKHRKAAAVSSAPAPDAPSSSATASGLSGKTAATNDRLKYAMPRSQQSQLETQSGAQASHLQAQRAQSDLQHQSQQQQQQQHQSQHQSQQQQQQQQQQQHQSQQQQQEQQQQSHRANLDESLLNESFINKAAVANDFHEEMLDWYDQTLKKPTVV